jgi:hypothetical protein
MQNSKSVVLFDIDYTLFDKDLFLNTLFNSIAEIIKMDRSKVVKYGHIAYKNTALKFDHFEPCYFSQIIADDLGKLEYLKQIKKIVLDKYNNPGCLYDETIDVVKKISKIAIVGIFSKGKLEFQKAKLKSMGAIKFFNKENIHIFDNKDLNLEKTFNKYKNSKIFFIDDKLNALYLAKKYQKNIFTVWVKRGIYFKNQKPIPGFTADAEVENLSEVVRIVKSNL